VVDACGDPVSPSQLRVLSVSSDEPENVNGNGDGNTLDDIVIECPNVVRLRSERAGSGNGRVYTIRYAVLNQNGGETEAVCTVGVPHDQGNGDAILGPGPGYSVQANCPAFLSPVPRPRSGDPLAVVVESPSLRISRDQDLGLGFSFALERPEPAHIDVFDIAGRRLTRLHVLPFVGPQTVYWDGRNADGREVAAGIYLVRAYLNGGLQHGKVLWRR